MKKAIFALCGAACGAMFVGAALMAASGPTLTIATPMAAPKWALLERQLLADNVPPAREFYRKYFDDRGYLQVVRRWGADDGADDAFEISITQRAARRRRQRRESMYLKGHEGLIKQHTEEDHQQAGIPRGMLLQGV
jgi:hypothetical protein